MFSMLYKPLLLVSAVLRILSPNVSETHNILAGLPDLNDAIQEVMRIGGVPGISIGVSHQGNVMYKKAFGFRNLEEGCAPDENTTFIIGSMTKAITAALTGHMVEAGKVSWDSKIRDIVPSFCVGCNDTSSELTITDLLSHRTGLAENDNLWIGSNNQNLLDYDQSIAVLSHTKRVAPIRSHFIYNNFAYDVMSHVIEKVSHKSFGDSLDELILKPLSLQHTSYGVGVPEKTNQALPYGILADGRQVRLPVPLIGDKTLMRAAGGIRSNIHDLLILYQAFNDAANKQIIREETAEVGDPLKQMKHLWQANMPIASHSIREYSYASGWVRVQLPARMGLKQHDVEFNPMVGESRPSRLAVFHQGSVPGYSSYVALFPETSSTVVVLSNSISLVEHARWIGELLIEALFENRIDPQRYIDIAKKQSHKGPASQTALNELLERESKGSIPCRPIQDYTGRYWNDINNFFIDVIQQGNKLFVAFQGRDADKFGLFSYKEDQFYWKLTYDELIRLAREPGNPKEFYILSFGSTSSRKDTEPGDGKLNIDWLEWKHDPSMRKRGEIFFRA